MVFPSKATTTISTSTKYLCKMDTKRSSRRAQAKTYWGLSTFNLPLQQWRRKIIEQNRYRRWNVGPSLWSRIQKADYGMETSWLASDEEINAQSSLGRVMLTRFLDSKGPTLEDYMEKGFTIQFKRGLRYSVLLAINLKLTILTKTTKRSVEECFVVAWRCTIAYGGSDGLNH